MVQPVSVLDRDWAQLEQIACCQFSTEQREAIIDELTVCRDYRDYLSEMVSRQDVKRTLTAIAQMRAVEIIDAYNNCDQITDVLIYEAAWFQYGVNVLTCTDYGQKVATIRKAAAFVLENLPETKGGRPRKSHHTRLARFCAELWVRSGNRHVANTWDGNPSPMVEFARYIFDLVDDDLTDPSRIAELLNSAR